MKLRKFSQFMFCGALAIGSAVLSAADKPNWDEMAWLKASSKK